MSGSGKLLAPVHTCGRFWPDLGNSEVIHWTKNALSLEVIDLASQFEETAPGLSATRNRPPEPTENSVRINPHPCDTPIADLVDALFLLAPVVECIRVQGVRVANESVLISKSLVA